MAQQRKLAPPADNTVPYTTSLRVFRLTFQMIRRTFPAETFSRPFLISKMKGKHAVQTPLPRRSLQFFLLAFAAPLHVSLSILFNTSPAPRRIRRPATVVRPFDTVIEGNSTRSENTVQLGPAEKK